MLFEIYPKTIIIPIGGIYAVRNFDSKSFESLTVLSFLILQEEIVDETDEYVDVHKRYCLIFRGTACYKLHSSTSAEYIICTKMNYIPCRIRVAAAAAASSVARAPSVRRLTAQKASVSGIF